MDLGVKLWMFLVVVMAFSSSFTGGDKELKQTIVSDGSRNITIAYKNIGCFKDINGQRSLPTLLADLRRELPSVAIASCAKLSWLRGYQGFGVQFYGECWTDRDVLRRYDVYNTSDACDRGIGGHWANTVYFFTNTTPLITNGPRPWRGTSGTSVSLQCQVKSPFDVRITWYKDLEENAIVHTSETYNINAAETDQGYYWCKVTTRFDVGVQSSKVLVVLQDYFTSIVKFIHKFKPNSRSGRSLKLCEPCEKIVEYLSGQDSVRYTRGSCRTWSGSKNIEVECTIYRKRNNQDITDYYENLRTTVQHGARLGRLPYMEWRSVTVSDAEYCIQETTGRTTLQGVFKWPMLKPGQSAAFECPYGPRDLNATRICVGDFTRGVAWKDPDVGRCGFSSKKTSDLDDLSQVKVNSTNVKQVAKKLTELFRSNSGDKLTGSDAEIAVDVVQNIVEQKGKLNETAGLVLTVVDSIMSMNKTILAKNPTTASKITKALDNIAKNIPIRKEKSSVVFNTTNLILQANQISTNAFKGITFGVSKEGNKATSPEQAKLSVNLPPSLLRNTAQESIRIGFIYFSNNKFFQEAAHQGEEEDKRNESIPSKQVLSSTVYDTNTSNLLEPVVLTFPTPAVENGYTLNSSCVYWDVYDRKWSNVGCYHCKKDRDGKDSNVVECCCDHLTSFAVLFSPSPSKPSTEAYKKHAAILGVITYVGCTISLIGVLLTFLTYLMFRHLRKTNQQPILMNLCIAIALLLIVFVAGINSTDNRLGCQIVAVLLHYLTLVTVLWMGIEAYNLYLQIVKVMAIYQRRFMLKAALVGWGAPLVIVFATVIAATVEYDKSKDVYKTFKYGSDFACVLDDNLYKIIAWFAPILGILLFNLITFVLVIYKLNSTGAMITVDSKSQQRRRCWTALAIMCLLGLTWLFGALAISDARIAFEYLFCIFNSLQGFFIFFFHCIRIREVRSQWSFFVSGLGFSHRESEYSHQKSKGFDESHHSSEAFVRVRSWIDKDGDSQPAKESPIMNHSPRRDSAQDQVELNQSTHANNNSYMT